MNMNLQNTTIFFDDYFNNLLTGLTNENIRERTIQIKEILRIHSNILITELQANPAEMNRYHLLENRLRQFDPELVGEIHPYIERIQKIAESLRETRQKVMKPALNVKIEENNQNQIKVLQESGQSFLQGDGIPSLQMEIPGGNPNHMIQFFSLQGPVKFQPAFLKFIETKPIEIQPKEKFHIFQRLGSLTKANLSEHIHLVLDHYYKLPLPGENQVTVPNLNGKMVLWDNLSENEKQDILIANKKGQASELFIEYEGPRHLQDIIPRWCHGCMHISRASMEVLLIVQMYKKYSQSKIELSEEDILLAQYLTAFHDSARQAEGVDVWDAVSAENARPYLQAMGYSKEKVEQAIDDLKNKDCSNHANKSLISKLIHDADCLDIMRVYGRKDFQFNKLDMAQDFQASHGFMQDLDRLLTELYKFIEWTEKPFFKSHMETHAKNFLQEITGLVGFQKKRNFWFPFLKSLLEQHMGILPRPSHHVKIAFDPKEAKLNSMNVKKKLGILEDLKKEGRGGEGLSYIVGNEKGNIFFWKKGDDQTIHSEVGGSQLASDITGGLVPIAYPRNLVKYKNMLKGTSQPYIEMNRGPFAVSENEPFIPDQLTSMQREQLFAHMIADRVISNYDTHTGQFGIDEKGNVIGFDKGQSFKFFGIRAYKEFDRSEPQQFDPDFFWNPISPNQPVYSNFCAFLKRHPDELERIWNSSLIQHTLRRCKNINIQQIKNSLINYAKVSFKGFELRFLNKVLSRAQFMDCELQNYFRFARLPDIENPPPEDDLIGIPSKVRIFLDLARNDLTELSVKELEKGLEEALASIEHIVDSVDKTTIVKIAEIVSFHKIFNDNNYIKAIKIRMRVAEAIPPSGIFTNLGSEISEAHPILGLKLQPLGTGMLKNQCLHLQKREYQDGTSRIRLDAKLKIPSFHENILKVMISRINQKELLLALPHNFCKSVTIHEEDIVYAGRENHPSGKSYFSSNPRRGFIFINEDDEEFDEDDVKLDEEDEKFEEIEPIMNTVIRFEGAGEIKICTDSRCLAEFGHMTIVLDPKITAQEAPQKLHYLLAAFGVGSLSLESRPEDIERNKVLQLLRAYNPDKAAKLEQMPETFYMSIEKLKRKAILEALLNNRDLNRMMVKQEVYPGQYVWSVDGLEEEVRRAGGLGLMTGLTGDFNTSINHLASLLKIGALSSQDRLEIGIIVLGDSTMTDLKSGGGESVFCRLITKKMSNYPECYPMHGSIQILYDLKLVERVGYCYKHDMFGTKKSKEYHLRPSILNLTQTIEGSSFPMDYRDNEVCIRNRISPDYIKGILVENEEEKQLIIETLMAEDLITENLQFEKFYRGIPVDDFIHVGNLKGKYWGGDEEFEEIDPRDENGVPINSLDFINDGMLPLKEKLFLVKKAGRSLTSLKINDALTNEQLDEIIINCPNLQNLVLDNCSQIIDFSEFTILKNLSDLRLSICPSLKNGSIEYFSKKLKSLYLGDCPSLDDKFISLLPKNLKKLVLCKIPKITDKGIKNLPNHIQSLELNNWV